MASLGFIKFTKDSLMEMLDDLKSSGQNELEVTISINDVVNKENSIKVFAKQLPEEIRTKEDKRFFSKTGKIFWSNNVEQKEIFKKTSYRRNTYRGLKYDESFKASQFAEKGIVY